MAGLHSSLPQFAPGAVRGREERPRAKDKAPNVEHLEFKG
jgi:hypothetical protein